MKKSSFPAFLIAAAVGGFTYSGNANADALYFQKVPVRTSSEATCLRFARDVSRRQGFQNAHSNNSEAAGTIGGAYVSITCVGRGTNSAIAVVMSMAPAFDNARRVGEFVSNKMRGITCIDLPC